MQDDDDDFNNDFNNQPEMQEDEEAFVQTNNRKKQEAVRSVNPAARKNKDAEKPAAELEVKQEEKLVEKEPEVIKETKKDVSEIDDYEDNWDMSDHDL